MIALDTNLLVYAFDTAMVENHRARYAISEAAAEGRGWGVPLAAAVEFWNAATRPAGRGPAGSAAEVAAFLRGLRDAGAQLWVPLHGFGERLVEAAVADGVIGRRIFDWQIALTALENRATELWTHDRSFRAPAGLRVVDPLE